MKVPINGRRGFLKGTGAAVLGLAGVPSVALAQNAGRAPESPRTDLPVKLELGSAFGTTSPSALAVEAFVARARALSGGTVQLSISRTSHAEVYSRVENGHFALGTFEAPELWRVEPVFRLSALPMLAASYDEVRTLAKVAKPHYEAALARHGQRLLMVKAFRPVLIWSRSPFASTKDLVGAQVISARRDWSAPMVRLGAKETSGGTPDFVVAGPRSSTVVTYGDSIRHVTQVFWAMPLQFFTANSKAFDTMSAATRETLIAAGAEVERELWNSAEEGARSDYAAAEAKGIVVQRTPGDDLISSLREAARADVDEWATEVGAAGRQILDEYRLAAKRR